MKILVGVTFWILNFCCATLVLAQSNNENRTKQIVTIIWGWSASDGLANISRTLAHEANSQQKKYHFVFDTKSGAGGAIAADHVKKTANTILATSSAFFIRPNLYPATNPYSTKDFVLLLPQCFSPISISSTKYHSWNEILAAQSIFVGNSGMGSTTHLAGIQLQSIINTITFVPYKSPAESFTAMLAGEIDLDVGFIGAIDKVNSTVNNKKISILGITGLDRSFKIPLLVDQGFPPIFGQLTLPLHLVVAANTPYHKVKEWQDILIKASKSEAVRNSYASNFCAPLDDIKISDLPSWFNSQVVRWKNLSKGINLE